MQGKTTMDNSFIILTVIGCIIIFVIVLSVVLYSIFRSPFRYPYCYIDFDISGRRSPDVNDLIDEYINKNGIDGFCNHVEKVKSWKRDCIEIIEKSKLKKLRQQQYREIIDDNNMFVFSLNRKQTRYKQVNYVKSAYTVLVTISKFSCNMELIKQRYTALSKIGFECTLSEYHSKDQRKRMTKALRDEIAIRDNYTCQICGKYMPDGVGLHIDHIIPIAKGGKSIPSNLQVLCSKCNGKKSKN